MRDVKQFTVDDQWFLKNGYMTSHYDRESGYVITATTSKLRAVIETIFRNQGNQIVITPEVLMETINSGKAYRKKHEGYIKVRPEEKIRRTIERHRLKALNGNNRVK